jgi:hypothetical protein
LRKSGQVEIPALEGFSAMDVELASKNDIGVDTFKKFTLLNINNRLGHDVKDKVLPVSNNRMQKKRCHALHL